MIHPVFRQLQPLADDPFCPKFIDDLIIISSIALALTSLNYAVFWQHSQLQFWQNDPGYRQKITLSKAFTVKFETFGLFAIALGLSVEASLIAADGEFVFSVISVIIGGVESKKDLIEDLLGGQLVMIEVREGEMRLIGEGIFIGECKL